MTGKEKRRSTCTFFFPPSEIGKGLADPLNKFLCRVKPTESYRQVLWAECVPPKFLYWSPISFYDGIWRQGFGEMIWFGWAHEGESTWQISALIREDRAFCFSTHMHWGKTMWLHMEKGAVCKPGSGFSLGAESAGTFILDSSLQNYKKHFCCLSCPVCGIMLQHSKQIEKAGWLLDVPNDFAKMKMAWEHHLTSWWKILNSRKLTDASY